MPTIASSPRWQWLMSAARFDCVPEGKSSAASKPKSSAARACRRFTLGSSPKTSSPSSASIIARRMPGEGRVTVSERRSTMAAMPRSLIAFLALLPAVAAWGQIEEVVTSKLERHSIAGLVMRLPSPKGFKHGIALFPGHPGILKLQEQNGQPRFELRGNFLVRSRRHWLDDETLVVVLDAPSDQWHDFPQHFRATARYGSDVARLLGVVAARFPVESWTFVGTSEGSVSAFHAARMNPQLARHLILTASLFEPGRNGPGLAGARFDPLAAPLLWVHHAEDPCRFTPYHQA